MENSVITRAPTRIDFGGGWTDVPPYSDEMGGYVCNLAISRFATVTVSPGHTRLADTPLPLADRSIAHAAARRFGLDHALITVRSEFPVGSGLGGSSAVGVAAVAACAAARGEVMTPDAMAELSREIEIADMEIPSGRQDHYAAAYGGALGLSFSARRVEVRSLPLSPQMRTEIEQRCLIIYTGQSRISGDTITAVLDAYRDRQPETLAALARMRQLAQEMADTLVAGDLDTLGALVAEHWKHQRLLHPAIPTPAIDEIIRRARETGAIGAKALGASGGGCVFVISRADRVEQIRNVVASLGEILPFSIAPGVERVPRDASQSDERRQAV